tara:strand:- start:14628 stop:15194 length:567 start_codon:yes stop_codon:yes gene_type:complete
MSVILYYSNFCEHSKELLQYLTKQSFTSINYLCIDKRFSKNGNTYIIMENQKHIILPSIITSVPSLLLLDDGNKILLGKEIYKYFKPKQVSLVKDATNNDEPESFILNSSFGNSISSDTFSFYDMDSNDMTAKGDGGTRQMHTYASINFNDKIETPDEDYKSDKIGEVSIEKLQSQRNSEIPQPQMRI